MNKEFWWKHCEVRIALCKEHGITFHSIYARKPKIRIKPRVKERFNKFNTPLADLIVPPIPQPLDLRAGGINTEYGLSSHKLLGAGVQADYNVMKMGWHVRQKTIEGWREVFIPAGCEDMFDTLGLTQQ